MKKIKNVLMTGVGLGMTNAIVGGIPGSEKVSEGLNKGSGMYGVMLTGSMASETMNIMNNFGKQHKKKKNKLY